MSLCLASKRRICAIDIDSVLKSTLLLVLGISIGFILFSRSSAQSASESTQPDQQPPAVVSKPPEDRPLLTKKQRKLSECFRETSANHERIEQFKDILDNEYRPNTTNNNLFFLETSCLHSVPKLTVRQACTIESTARNNPNMDVYLIYAAPVGFERNGVLSPIFQVLRALPNVHFRTLNWWTYSNGTAAESFAHSLEIFTSSSPVAHMSDFLRLVTVHRFGGMYMDLDVVTMRSFDTLPPSFVSQEQPGGLCNGLLRCTKTGIGHLISMVLLRNFVDNFNGSCWACNGPAVITRVLSDICEPQVWNKCDSPIAILESESFFPIYGTVWEQLFQANYTNASLAKMSNKTLGVHMWNAITENEKVWLNETSVYAMLARSHCPNALATVQKDYF